MHAARERFQKQSCTVATGRERGGICAWVGGDFMSTQPRGVTQQSDNNKHKGQWNILYDADVDEKPADVEDL